MDFGIQVVNSLQLLSMHKPKTSLRYYHSARDAIFGMSLIFEL